MMRASSMVSASLTSPPRRVLRNSSFAFHIPAVSSNTNFHEDYLILFSNPFSSSSSPSNNNIPSFCNIHGVAKNDEEEEHKLKRNHNNPLFSSLSQRRLMSSAPINKMPLSPSLTNEEERMKQYQQIRLYHTTQELNRGVPTVVMTLGAVALTAKAAQYALRAYNELKEMEPTQQKGEEVLKYDSKTADEDKKKENTKEGDKSESSSKAKEEEDGEKRENFFARFFGVGVGSKYYEGGFEEKMTRREAALVLGVRESSTTQRIKEAHRKLAILNHPDTGGSTFLSGKINEAKELLLKGRKDA